MELWDRLFTLFRVMRGYGLRHYELNERLQTALVERAHQDQRPAEDIQAELLAAGLGHLEHWDFSEWGTKIQSYLQAGL